MKQKLIALLLAAIMVLTMLVIPVCASVQSSYYFDEYSCSLSQDSRHGRVIVYVSVSARSVMTELGVSKIKMYKADGTLYQTITGSTSNGLMTTNDSYHTCTKYIDCSSGSTYYFEITYKAKNANGSEYKTITTGTIQAP